MLPFFVTPFCFPPPNNFHPVVVVMGGAGVVGSEVGSEGGEWEGEVGRELNEVELGGGAKFVVEEWGDDWSG